MKYDVVVAGGGYGGLVAAQTAAKEGAETLLLEKKKTIGERVASTGAVSLKAIKAFNIDKSVLSNQLVGSRIYSSSGKSITTHFGRGYMTKKKDFFELFARLAREGGVEILTSHRVKDVIKEKDWVRGVVAEHNGKDIEIDAKVVIAADGIPSVVSRKSGLGNINRFLACKRYVAEGVSIETDKYLELLVIGNNCTPGGGAWMFPYSKSLIDFGFGVLNTRMKKSLESYASDFMNNSLISEKIKGGKIIEEERGFIPVTGPLKKTYGNGIMSIGDAAGLTNPLTTEGIKYAMFTGEMAGKVAANAIKRGNCSKTFLFRYEKEWKKRFKKRLKIMKKGREIFEKCNEEDMEYLVDAYEKTGLSNAEKKIAESEKYDIPHIVKYTLSNCRDVFALAKLVGWGLRNVL